jgi:membrane protease YdiL (CAAX protease family)
MDFFTSIFLNTNKEWRAGWKTAFFVMLIIILTFFSALLLKILPEDYQRIPFAMLISAPLASWISIKFIDQKSLKNIGLLTGEGAKVIFVDCILGLLAGAAAMGVIALLITFYGGSFTLNPSLITEKVITFFLLMIAVGITEELQVRGYMLRVISDGFRFGSMTIQQGFWTAAIFTSIIFGLLHFFNPNASFVSTLNISLAGILLVWPIAVTGRMYGAFALHFSWNWFQGGLFGFPVSGQAIQNSIYVYTMPENATFFSGGDFGPEAGIVGLIGMIIASLPFWFIYMRQNRTLRIFETQFEQIKD